MTDRFQPRVTVRRIRQKATIEIAPPPRRAGQKMGLTTEQLLAAAKQVLATTPGHLTIKAVASVLGVA